MLLAAYPVKFQKLQCIVNLMTELMSLQLNVPCCKILIDLVMWHH